MNTQTQQIFTEIWETRRWASADGQLRSGKGTSLDYTTTLRKLLPVYIQHMGIKSVFDAPCGDLNWMSQIDLGDVEYTGADIVPAIVAELQVKYPEKRFVEFDITEDAIPKVDLWLCRSCLNHLSNQDIKKAFTRLLASKVKWVMFTSHPGADRVEDIKTGGFRKMDLHRAPFKFPPSHAAIEDWMDGFPRRQLLLWRVDTLRPYLERLVK